MTAEALESLKEWMKRSSDAITEALSDIDQWEKDGKDPKGIPTFRDKIDAARETIDHCNRILNAGK